MEEAADEGGGDEVEAPLGIVAILQLVLDDDGDGRSIGGEAKTSLSFEKVM